MAYLLQHTAEAIDRKLELIDENKNLLPYPYDVNFDEYTALEDVGDGSILLTETIDDEKVLLLNDLSLATDKDYRLSLTITDILENATTISGCRLIVKEDTTEQAILGTTTDLDSLRLSTETPHKAVLVYLEIPKGAAKGLLIKPQIEEYKEKQTMGVWVPNMDKIGTYVDRRFNGLNAKIRVLTDLVESLIENPALPDSSESNPTSAFKGIINADNKSMMITEYTGNDTIVIIPSKIQEYDVTSIGMGAFAYCDKLVSVEIPDSVESIEDCAFWSCNNLVSIEIPDSVTYIGDKAFCYCSSLPSINLPNSITSIGKSMFYHCDNLTSIELPDSVTSIGDKAFAYCSSLPSIEFIDGVTSIGEWAFGNCDSLVSINIPNSVKSIGDYAFSYCANLTSVEIPDSVTSIGYGAFGYCDSLTSIEIPNSVTSIGNAAFRNCSSLTSVTIGDSVASIGAKAFYDCPNLKTINCRFGSTDSGATGAPWGATEATINYNYK